MVNYTKCTIATYAVFMYGRNEERKHGEYDNIRKVNIISYPNLCQYYYVRSDFVR